MIPVREACFVRLASALTRGLYPMCRWALRRRLRWWEVTRGDERSVPCLQHPGGALLELRLIAAETHPRVEQLVHDVHHHVAVRAEGGRTRGRRGEHQLRRVADVRALCDRVAGRDGHPPCVGQRLQRLDAAQMRARDQSGERSLSEQRDQARGLSAPLRVEGTELVA